MVAYLDKLEGSEGFHQIVDFLNTSHIRTLDNGETELTATIDGQVNIVTEASVRRHLQLADTDGISSLPSTKIFKQLALMDSPPHTHVADEATSIGIDVRIGGAATTLSSLEAGQGSGNIAKTSSMPCDSPLPRVNILGSDKGRMQQNKLMELVTKLTDRVVALEIDLKQTKQTYCVAFTKLIKEAKKLERTVKSSQARRRSRVVISDEEDLEDSSKQGRKIAAVDQEPNITLVQHDAEF
ncbi:hypothetical protein Tco_0145192 [Tanacetum coccineum]